MRCRTDAMLASNDTRRRLIRRTRARHAPGPSRAAGWSCAPAVDGRARRAAARRQPRGTVVGAGERGGTRLASIVEHDVDLSQREPGQRDVEVEVDEALQLACQDLDIPAGVQRQRVVSDEIRATFGCRQVRQRQRRPTHLTVSLPVPGGIWLEKSLFDGKAREDLPAVLKYCRWSAGTRLGMLFVTRQGNLAKAAP